MSDLKNSYAVHFGKTYYYKEREAVLTGKRKPDPMHHRIRNFGSYSSGTLDRLAFHFEYAREKQIGCNCQKKTWFK